MLRTEWLGLDECTSLVVEVLGSWFAVGYERLESYTMFVRLSGQISWIGINKLTCRLTL